ncbi:MAG: helix-turn-helix domain-containing protein [Pseudomonadota bacterium]|nr:helix-turn-helix domain-containing protein [Pseudomonadota bacterium]
MTEQEVVRLGRRISARRHKLGLGLRALAERAGIDHTTLHRVECGKFADPDLAKITKVLEVLELSPTRGMAVDVAARLPEMGAYFRAKTDLTPDQIEQVTAYIQRLRDQS